VRQDQVLLAYKELQAVQVLLVRREPQVQEPQVLQEILEPQVLQAQQVI
jgi:hypothetical protein